MNSDDHQWTLVWRERGRIITNERDFSGYFLFPGPRYDSCEAVKNQCPCRPVSDLVLSNREPGPVNYTVKVRLERGSSEAGSRVDLSCSRLSLTHTKSQLQLSRQPPVHVAGIFPFRHLGFDHYQRARRRRQPLMLRWTRKCDYKSFWGEQPTTGRINAPCFSDWVALMRGFTYRY